jgi:N utilization substance protein A
MKSEFILAFNEICELRGLPKEDVFEALKTALVSAYRRDMNVSNSQEVTVEIDPRTGESTIFAEKEVVEEIVDGRTEVLIQDARLNGHADAQLGDVLMVDSTTSGFGRIAAQTAKQVLLQRVREAEREQLYEDFSGREGELVNGTVQSISGQHVTIGLGRTEAIMPKSQQVRGERYRAHDKIRVYVLEVRRTNRGPQIFVSRNHRNLLRRLLELEVPEIYNGQVEIKSIAREAGQRSKVAVMALQPGVDPVGACVGMRGVRIQSIVRELNDEKIDVIEWNPDQKTFIAKALSPARVSFVFLDEHPDLGKTAIVIVPDDQLSLAIGREGQNARLAAKLTGWRIDIKSLIEAATESLNNLGNADANPKVTGDKELIEQAGLILAKKQAGRPITSEDYLVLERLVSGVEGAIIAVRAAGHEEVRKLRAEARKKVPPIAWELPLDELDLPGRIHNLLLDNEIETVGHVLHYLEIGDEIFLNFRGVGEKALETLKEHVAAFKLPQPAEAEVKIDTGAELEAAGTTEEAAVDVAGLEAVAEIAGVQGDDQAAGAVAEAVEAEDQGELVAAMASSEGITSAGSEAEEMVGEVTAAPVIPELDDLSRPLVQVTEPEEIVEEKPKPAIVLARPTREEEREEIEKRKGRKGKQLVFDEKVGEVIVKRKRRGSRRRPDWEEMEEEEF